MSMITKCPACGTSFRVTPRQLQAQHGMVRCGRCAAVFDGFKELATQRDISPLEAAPPAAIYGESGVAEVFAPPGGDVQSPPELQTAPPRSEAAAPPPQPAVVIGEIQPPAPVFQGVPSRSEPATLAQEPAPAAVTITPQVTYVEAPFESAPVARRGGGGLAFGIFPLLLALAAQGVYFYRGDIAAYVPEARPYLNRICEQLRCTVALPQRPRSISIEASDLQATDPANPGLITLTATLRNHAATTLGYPALDVVLTSAKEHTVARRIFLPGDYLGGSKDARAGIPPNAEITVKLDIDSGDLGAAGFRLDLLAAPER